MWRGEAYQKRANAYSKGEQNRMNITTTEQPQVNQKAILFRDSDDRGCYRYSSKSTCVTGMWHASRHLREVNERCRTNDPY